MNGGLRAEAYAPETPRANAIARVYMLGHLKCSEPDGQNAVVSVALPVSKVAARVRRHLLKGVNRAVEPRGKANRPRAESAFIDTCIR